MKMNDDGSSKPLNKTFFLKIFITYRCNLHCRHCVQSRIASRYESSKSDQLYLRHLTGFITAAQEKNRDFRIYVSGGEPLLSSRFFDTARIIKDRGMTYKTITNGLLLGKVWNRLLEAPPQGIWVTFNGTGHNHDRIVGLKGAYDRLYRSVSQSISHLKQAGIKVGAVLMINSLTHDRLSKDYDEIAALEFDEIVLQHLSFLSNEVMDAHGSIFKQEFNRDSYFCFGENVDGSGIDPVKLYDQLIIIKGKNHRIRQVIFPPLETIDQLIDYYGENPAMWRNRRCQRALRELWVHPDGTVSVCFSQEVGDISQPYDQIIQSPELLHWQTNFRRLPEPLPGCMRCHRLYM